MKIKLFFLGFPNKWKQELIELEGKMNPRFDSQYALPTNILKDCLNSWLENIVDIKPIRTDSDDQKWLIATEYPNTEKICEIIKIWITGYYISPITTGEIKDSAKKLKESISAKELEKYIQEETVFLFTDDGRAACDYTYKAYVLYFMNRLIGKKLNLFGHELLLCRAENNELVTTPVLNKSSKENKTEYHPYSYT